MFVSHDSISPKKKIQKPNILRRKTKVPSNTTYPVEYDSPNSKSLIITPSSAPTTGNVIAEPNIPKKYKDSVQVLKINNLIQKQEVLGLKKSNMSNMNAAFERNEAEQCYEQSDIQVNSYFLKEDMRQQLPLVENVVSSKGQDTQEKPKWMEFINNTHKIIIGQCNVESIHMEPTLEVMSTVVPLSMSDTANTNNSGVNTSNSYVAKDANSMKFKCDINDCNKEFPSEQKLKKHKSLHNKDGTIRPQRQSTIECPVRKTHGDGSEEPCGRIFSAREDLAKHLNEEHIIDEAAHKCEECGRRFFWASGLRAHVRSHAARRRAALACAWPGCDRVFRQPCRLREHTRAHTGDKPYPCQHPNCGWSFRTASKLVRHARRHTGERRHACAVCGRAFLRREHLREHAARHHAPNARRAHACTVPDCQQSFTNMSSLYMHMKKIHKKEKESIPTEEVDEQIPNTNTENMFMISLLDPENVLAGGQTRDGDAEVVLELGETDAGAEGHAARTHCTWPLTRVHAYDAQDAPHLHAHDTPHVDAHDAYVLGEDVHVEPGSEGAESNIYTIRSDLFLHGNIIHNEDSEHMARGRAADAETLALDADLLLDAPSVDIAQAVRRLHEEARELLASLGEEQEYQEELYADAVDESSFRVFLLSGEELAVTE